MPARKKASTPLPPRRQPVLPLHREFVAHFFVVIILLILSFTSFVGGYAVGRREMFGVASDALSSLDARWKQLKARGVLPLGPLATSRLTGRVRAVDTGGFLLETDPVHFELFSDEPRVRVVGISGSTFVADLAADGSQLRSVRPLAVGDRVAVSASGNIRTKNEIAAERVERFWSPVP